MELIRLFITFLKIGAFSFGGGYAMLPLIEKEVVNIHGWLTSTEFVDIIAISEMSPGPISINTATFIGFRLFDVKGAVLATLGVVLVSFFLVTILARLIIQYKGSPFVEGIFGGIRPAVIGLIAAACVALFQTSIIDFRSFVISLIVFMILYKSKLHPIGVILLSGVLGIVFYSL
ncbi:chromate transporter [Clostridium formicaceticum]|uniref:Chromate transport protein n=1 Tax=Clostridium formicaceticum TaxID=1497 RepID=A0AAC9RJL2_9CLOT|nr:chromate transporter [Clostridium formicaceticum]AOY75940.1 chromate transporter [Clostridium formicaceticum]ARE86288.1 putative chromate transport protein [Clostridium formicaceticum]